MIALLIILGILVLLAFVPVTVSLGYNEGFVFDVKVLGLKLKLGRKKEEKPQDEEQTPPESEEEKAVRFSKELFGILRSFINNLFSLLKKYAIIKNVKVRIKFGLSDAAATAMAFGGICAAVHGFTAWVYNAFRVKNHSVEVVPDFDNQGFEAEALLIFRLFLIQLIIIVLRLMSKGIEGYKLINKRNGEI